MSSAQLLPNVLQTWFNANGLPLAGGQIFSYIAGTSTPQATYTDETAGTPNTNPVVLNSAGQASIWLRTDLSYKIVVEDSLNNVLATIDNINIVNPGTIDKIKIAANVANVALAQNGSGSLDVQVDNVYIQVNGNNQLTLKAGAITADFLPSTSKLEVIFKNTRDLSDPGSIKTIPQYEWSSPTPVAGPTLAGVSNCSKWSPSGEFLASGCASSPYIYFFQKSSLGLTKLADPATIPGGATQDIAWSPCGDFCAVLTSVTPYIYIYQRTGNLFTKLADPASVPGVIGGGFFGRAHLAWSPNSDFLALSYSTLGGTHAGAAFILYERDEITFNDITSTTGDLNTLASANGGGYMAWSADSSLFAILDNSSGPGLGVAVFERQDFTFTAITEPVVTSLTGGVQAFEFSPDGNFLAVISTTAPYLLLFAISNNAFSIIANPALPPTSLCVGLTWSANSEYLAIGVATTPFIFIYKVIASAPSFTKQADLATLPTDEIFRCDFSQSKQFLAMACNSTPFLLVYETASVLPSDALLWVREAPNV